MKQKYYITFYNHILYFSVAFFQEWQYHDIQELVGTGLYLECFLKLSLHCLHFAP